MNKIGLDKVWHALACLGATVGSFLLMRIFFPFAPSCYASWYLPMGLGLGKEYGDSKASGNKWDWWDIVADAVGIAIGILGILIWHWIANKGA